MKLLGYAILAPITLAILVALMLIDGWALRTIWNWFMPTLFGLPSLTLVGAMAIALVVGYLTRGWVNTDGKSTEYFVHQVIRPPLVVFVGWILTHWLPA